MKSVGARVADSQALAARIATRDPAALRRRGLWPNRSLTSLFEERVAATPEATIWIEGEMTLSFREASERSERLAAALSARGVQRGDTIAYQLPNWWEAAVVLLAALRLGAVIVPIVPILRARELSRILRETRPSFFFVRGDDQHLGLAREGVALAAVGSEAPEIVAVRAERPHLAWEDLCAEAATGKHPDAADPLDLAAIIYTSGSTAAPKGALHIHETLAAEILSLREAHDLGPADRVLMPSPLGHISGVIHGVLVPALLGTSAVLQPRWQAGSALRAIEEHRVTYMIGAPVFLSELLEHGDFARCDLSSLRLFSCGGAPVPPALLHAARDRLPGLVAKRVYGSSEFPTITTSSPTDAAERGLDSEGRPLRGVELDIVDADGAPCGADTEGEIRARGPECFLGYANPALDADAFDDEDRLRTGDLGLRDAHGYLRITGRLKDIIIRKGEKISAQEVEALLREHEAIAEAAVIAVPDQERGEMACACVRLAAGRTREDIGDTHAVSAWLRGRGLTPQKRPERLEVLEDLPRGASGKIDKRELVRRFSAR